MVLHTDLPSQSSVSNWVNFLCTALALVHAAVLAGLLAVIQCFQMCNKMKTILVGLYKQDQQRLTVNIYFSPAIFSSSAVLHKSTNIVTFYCSSKPTMCTCSGLDQYFIKVSCPRNSSQLYHRKLPFSRAAPSLYQDNGAPCWTNGRHKMCALFRQTLT